MLPYDDPQQMILTLLVSYIVTWGSGLTPPLLIRYAFLRRPLSKTTASWVAAGCSVFFWMAFRVFKSALGENPGTGAAWILIFFVARWILSREPAPARTPALQVAAAIPDGRGVSTLNWRKGLLRLWLVVNIPVAGYSGYSVYSNQQCVQEMQRLHEFWVQDLREKLRKAEEYRLGREQGRPGWQLPVFLDTPEKEIADSREALVDVNDHETTCRADGQSSLAMLFGAPIGSMLLIFSGLWVRSGLRNKIED